MVLRRYTRDPVVVQEMARLSAMSPQAMVKAACADASEGQARIREETMVFLCRKLHGDGEGTHAWTIAMELARRCRRKVTHSLALWRLDGPEANPSDIMDEVLTSLYQSLFDMSAKAAFWEIRFWICFDRMLLNSIRKRRRELDRRAELITPERPESHDEAIESLLDDLHPTHRKSLADPFTNVAVADALLQLPQAVRTAYILKHAANMQEESHTSANVVTISSVLGVSGRTVRNYLTRADALLSKWRSGLDGEKGAVSDA